MVAEADILCGQSLSVQYIADAVPIGPGFFDVSPTLTSKGFLDARASESVSIEIACSESVCI